MSIYQTLAAVNVNEHTAQKSGFTYLSWADAVDVLQQHYPEASWSVREWDGLPFVVGQMGQGGVDGASERVRTIKDAQASVGAIPEFRGNVKIVRTDVFWDLKAAALIENWRDHVEEWEKVGSDHGYHYLGSAIWHLRMGKAFAEAMIGMMGK